MRVGGLKQMHLPRKFFYYSVIQLSAVSDPSRGRANDVYRRKNGLAGQILVRLIADVIPGPVVLLLESQTAPVCTLHFSQWLESSLSVISA